MIIGTKGIPMSKKGYPTVSDKYNVAGGILEGETAVEFGELVKLGSMPGYYEAITGAVTVDKLAGFILATNVKLADWNSGKVETLPGEAFNLLLNGFIAVELDAEATIAKIAANEKVCVKLTGAALTTIDKKDDSTIVELPNAVFTGIYEKHGEKLFAEIYIK